MDFVKEFINEYGMTLINSILMALMGYLGVVIKKLYQKYVNDSTKQAVAKTVVNAVEQLYKDLHGEEKYQKAVEAMHDMLVEKGIEISELEIKMLIEGAVREFNTAIGKTDEGNNKNVEVSKDGLVECE